MRRKVASKSGVWVSQGAMDNQTAPPGRGGLRGGLKRSHTPTLGASLSRGFEATLPHRPVNRSSLHTARSLLDLRLDQHGEVVERLLPAEIAGLKRDRRRQTFLEL
jgi:hypothetical protein